MSAIDDLKQAFRDYVTDGIPASGEYEPLKAAIRSAFDKLGAEIATLGTAQVYATWSDLSGVTGNMNDSAIIYQDDGTHTDPVTSETVANTGIYLWTTAWERIADTEALKVSNAIGQVESWYIVDAEPILGKYYQYFTGALTANVNWESLELIAGSPGDVVRITSDVRGSETALAVWLKDDGVTRHSAVSRGSDAATTAYVDEELTFPTSGDGAYYLAVSGYRMAPTVKRFGVDPALKSSPSRLDTLESEATETASEIDKLKQWHEPSGYAVHVGEYYRNYDASVQALGPYRRLDSIPVKPGQKLKLDLTVSGSITSAIVWASATGAVLGTYIDGNSVAPIEVSFDDGESDPAPAGAAFALITSFYSASGKNPRVQVYGVPDEQPDYGAISEKLDRIGNTTDRAKGLNLLFTGTSIYDEKPTGGLPIPEQAAALLGATANNQALSSSMMRAGDATIADGAVVVGTIASNVLTVTEVLYGEIGVGMALSPAFVSSGTTIGSFGTGTGGTGTYTLANGGSIADVSEPTTIFIGDDPLGWSGRGYPTVTRALSHTAGEKEEIILNWSKWQPLLTASPPASLDANAQALIRGASFESRILPHLDDADALVVEHVMNDSIFVGHNGSVADIPADLRDRCTFIGAFNWLMDRVQAYRDANELPPLPVVFSGSYENTWHPFLLEAQEKAAALWQYPVIRTADKTGWSQQEVTTEGYWSGGTSGTWVASGGSPQTITFLNRALPDNLHPHKDDSNAACALLARILAVGLRDTL